MTESGSADNPNPITHSCRDWRLSRDWQALELVLCARHPAVVIDRISREQACQPESQPIHHHSRSQTPSLGVRAASAQQSSPSSGAMLHLGAGKPRGKLPATRQQPAIFQGGMAPRVLPLRGPATPAGPSPRSQAGRPGLPGKGSTRTTATVRKAPATTSRKPAKTLRKKNHNKGIGVLQPVHHGLGPPGPGTRPLHVASVCTGLATETLVLKHLLKRDLTHEFMCDKDDNVQKLLKANFPGTRIVSDATGPGFQGPAKKPVDLLVSGFPCQPYSRQGKRQGAEDGRADALEAILKWIRRNLPTLVVLENVVGLLDKKNRPTRVKIASALKDDYLVNWKVLRSSDFGLPQARRRWYLVARLKTAAQKVDLVIDLAASRSRQSSMLGKAPTITASRASTRSYFLTSAQRRALTDSC